MTVTAGVYKCGSVRKELQDYHMLRLVTEGVHGNQDLEEPDPDSGSFSNPKAK